MSRPSAWINVLAAAAIVGAAPNVRAAQPAQPAAAAAPAWSETFVPAKVRTYLGDDKPNVMVVGATATSEPAAEALRAALKASKGAGLVIDAQAIGVTVGLDDRTIVERSKGQPIGQIVIVRVFDGGPGEAQSAIVTFYRPDGTVVTAITSTAGVAIEANGGTAASAGVSTATVAAVETTLSDDSESKQEKAADAAAQAKYDAQYLWFMNWIGVSAQTGAVVASWSQIKRGKYGHSVEGKQLYQIIGRDDLLKRYRTRLGVKLGVGLPVTLGGLAMLNVGLVALLSNVSGNGPDFGTNDPLQMGRTKVPGPISNAGAGALMGIGGALMFAGMFFTIGFKAHPVNKAEAAQLMDTYNRGLRKELGLADKQARLRVGPTMGQYTGLAIGGRF